MFIYVGITRYSSFFLEVFPVAIVHRSELTEMCYLLDFFLYTQECNDELQSVELQLPFL